MRIHSLLGDEFDGKKTDDAWHLFQKKWDGIEYDDQASILAFTETKYGRVILLKIEDVSYILVRSTHQTNYGAIYKMNGSFLVYDKYISSIRLILTIENHHEN